VPAFRVRENPDERETEEKIARRRLSLLIFAFVFQTKWW
jgi:hypothetical protein